jgi:nitroimidazol reductase NimA-like FMN-containing flavoprotein (pyridoxamine 5'-phosphate oxidase superfamily)
MTEKISKPEVIKFLRSVNIMSLAACHGDKPLSTVLLYAVDDDFNFYFATRSETYKAKALAINPKVSLSVWEHKKMLIQVDGQAQQISNLERANEVVEMLADSTARIGDFWPPVVQQKQKGEYIIFKIKPDWLRALDLSNNTIRGDKDAFTEFDLK